MKKRCGYKRFILLFVLALIISQNSFGQNYLGTGFFVDDSGSILTNRHIIKNDCSSLFVVNTNQEVFKANVSYVSDKYDLALLKTDHENKYKIYLRMTPDYKNALLPSIEEHVHTVGYPDGKFEPRGGFVEKRSDPIFGNKGLSISLGTEPGASGSPVFDNHGLLVGILWGKSKKDSVFDMYALSAEAIIPFFIENNIPIGTSSIADAPYKSGEKESFFQMAQRIFNYASKVVVKVKCYE